MRFHGLVVFAFTFFGIFINVPTGLGAACSVSSGCYGSELAADSLANTVLGGPYDNVVSYRFRAGHNGR